MAKLVDRKLRTAAYRYDEASEAYMDALKSAMAPGRFVKWQHGKHHRSGIVVEVLGFHPSHARVRVSSSTSGKEIDVHAGTLVRGSLTK